MLFQGKSGHSPTLKPTHPFTRGRSTFLERGRKKEAKEASLTLPVRERHCCEEGGETCLTIQKGETSLNQEAASSKKEFLNWAYCRRRKTLLSGQGK